MEIAQTVLAVTDSPAVRETLSILLEHGCQLHFLGPDHLRPAVVQCADLAVIALQEPHSLLDNLQRRWPALPVVVVLGGASRAATSPGTISVPLEPLAIRNAVREGLRGDSDAALRRSVLVIVRTLRAELAYAFAALRTLAPLDAPGVGKNSYGLFAAVIHEQLCAIATAIEQLERFLAHPRALTRAPRFALALSTALAQPDAAARARGLLCRVASDTAAPPLGAGPIGLAPLIAEFLRWHLRRWSASPLATVRHTRSGVALRYRPQPATDSDGGSWPLLLASLLLQRWSWRVGRVRTADDETVAICPA